MELGLPVVLDGAYGEGGGALVRTALAMSALTTRPVRIQNVRGGTRFPGLTVEDRNLILALKTACAAETVFAEDGSHQVSFLPTRLPVAINEHLGLPQGGESLPHQSAPTMLTALAPVFARTGRWSTIAITGETHGHGALSYDVFAHQTLSAFRRFGLFCEPEIREAGYGRGSRGEISVEIEPSVLEGIVWKDRGELRTVLGTLCVSELSEEIGQRGASHLSRLAQHAGVPLEVEIMNPPAGAPGAFVAICGEFERGLGSGASLGARGLRIEAVVQSAFEKFLQWYRSDATVDEFLADQILVLAVLADSQTVLKVNRITSRLLTTIWVIKQFMPIAITVKGHEGEAGTITVKK